MILRYAALRNNEPIFRSFSGITVAEFDRLYKRFEPAWVEAEQVRLQRTSRRRAQGGGGDYRLDLETQLLMVLVWMRLYLTEEALGYLLGVHQSTVSRNVRRLLPVLQAIAQETLGWSTPKGGRRSFKQLYQEQPDLFAILDATEQSVNRPQVDEQARLHFSGKQRRPTCKTALLVNEQGLIRQVSPSSPGSVHDMTHVRQAGILAHLPPGLIAVADTGFMGLYMDLPNHSVLVPHKATRAHPLLPDQRTANREVSSVRIKVENVFAQLKTFHVLAHRFRHNVLLIHSQVFTILAALINWRTHDRLRRARWAC